MSEAKFTKGPWEWHIDRHNDGYYGLYANDEPVVYPQRCNDGDDGLAWFSTDEDYYGETALKQADADLIACVPEMYAMLESVSVILADINAYDEVNKIEALLAKARGEA